MVSLTWTVNYDKMSEITLIHYAYRTGHRVSLYQMILIGQLLMIETVQSVHCTIYWLVSPLTIRVWVRVEVKLILN